MAIEGLVVCVLGAGYAIYYKAAFIIFGCIILFGGIGGCIATTKRHWLGLFIVNCAWLLTALLMFVCVIAVGLLAFDVRDPVAESVDAAWVTMRPEMEEADLCLGTVCTPGVRTVLDLVPTRVTEVAVMAQTMPHCDLFRTWTGAIKETTNTTRNTALEKAGDGKRDTPCPLSVVDMVSNCSLVESCDTSSKNMHLSECNVCDSECKASVMKDLRGNTSTIVVVFYAIFFCACFRSLCWI
jgi:hypothetical protein